MNGLLHIANDMPLRTSFHINELRLSPVPGTGGSSRRLVKALGIGNIESPVAPTGQKNADR